MSIKLLSLDNSDINDEQLKNELIPFVNNTLLELYKIKKNMDDYEDMDMFTKMELMDNFKLIVDILRIYKNPGILSQINEYQKNNKNIEFNKDKNKDKSKNQSNGFGDFWNYDFGNKESSKSPSSESADSDEVDSVISEIDYDQDKFTNMINTANSQLYEKSTLRQLLTIERFYKCGLVDSDAE
jgi:hypothetical protein